MTQTQSAHFRGNPLFQATKRHLNNSQTVKKDEKLAEMRNKFSFVELLFSCPVLGITNNKEEEEEEEEEETLIRFSSHFSSFLTVYLLLSVVLYFDKDYPENLHIVCLRHSK